MVKCLGGGIRRTSIDEEVLYLQHALQRETLHRRAVEQQLHQEQAKCAQLEREIQHAAQAAHEMGESLRLYFDGSVMADAPAWGTSRPAIAPGMQRLLPKRVADVDTKTYDQADGRVALHSSSSSFKPGYAQARKPSAVALQGNAYGSVADDSYMQAGAKAHGPASRVDGADRGMQQHMMEVADRLKGLAEGWQQRLDDCAPLQDTGLAADHFSAPEGAGTVPKYSPAALAAAAAIPAPEQRRTVTCGSSDTLLAGPQVSSDGQRYMFVDSTAGQPKQPASRSAVSSLEDYGSQQSSYYNHGSSNSSSSTGVVLYDNGELQSSISSFPRMRSSLAPTFAGVAEESDCQHEWTQQHQQLPQNMQTGGGTPQLQQQKAKAVATLTWRHPNSDRTVPGCAITRGAAPLKPSPSVPAAAQNVIAPVADAAAIQPSMPSAALAAAAGQQQGQRHTSSHPWAAGSQLQSSVQTSLTGHAMYAQSAVPLRHEHNGNPQQLHLKPMGPLHRHKQYLYSSLSSFRSSMVNGALTQHKAHWQPSCV